MEIEFSMREDRWSLLHYIYTDLNHQKHRSLFHRTNLQATKINHFNSVFNCSQLYSQWIQIDRWKHRVVHVLIVDRDVSLLLGHISIRIHRWSVHVDWHMRGNSFDFQILMTNNDHERDHIPSIMEWKMVGRFSPSSSDEITSTRSMLTRRSNGSAGERWPI